MDYDYAELRSAVRRVRRIRSEAENSELPDVYGEGPVEETYGKYVKDCDDIVDAYLATVCEDDDEAVTESWLLSEGWYDDEFRLLFQGKPHAGIEWWKPEDDETCHASLRVGGTWLPHIKTRGQLRRLLSALKGE